MERIKNRKVRRNFRQKSFLYFLIMLFLRNIRENGNRSQILKIIFRSFLFKKN